LSNEFIAYAGHLFTIEWYFDEYSKSQALEHFEELSRDQKIQTLKLFRLMGDLGKIWDQSKFRNEGDSIYAFKPQPDRFLCFFVKGKKIIVTNGFTKKHDKLPLGEKYKALKIKNDYEKRVKKGEYYEQA
jgi:hypothetical protein